jgi:hypothetical protein
MSVLDEILGVITGNTKDRDRENKLGMSQSIHDKLAERAAIAKAAQEASVAKLLKSAGGGGPSQLAVADALQGATPAPATPASPPINPMDVLGGVTQQAASGMGNPVAGAMMNSGVSGRTPQMALAGQPPQLSPPAGTLPVGVDPNAPAMPEPPVGEARPDFGKPEYVGKLQEILAPLQQKAQQLPNGLTGAQAAQDAEDEESRKSFSMIASKALQSTDELRKQADAEVNARYPGKGGTAKRFMMDFLSILAGQNTAKFRKTQDLMNDREHYESLYKQSLVERGQNMKMQETLLKASTQSRYQGLSSEIKLAQSLQKGTRDEFLDTVHAGLAAYQAKAAEAGATHNDAMTAKLNAEAADALAKGSREKDPVGRLAGALATDEFLNKFGKAYNPQTATLQEQQTWAQLWQTKFEQANQMYIKRNPERNNNGRPSFRILDNWQIMGPNGPEPMTVSFAGRGEPPVFQQISKLPGGDKYMAWNQTEKANYDKAMKGVNMYSDMASSIANELIERPDAPDFGKIMGSRLGDWLYESGWFQDGKEKHATGSALVREILDNYAQRYVYEVSGKQTNQVEVEAIKSYMANRQKDANISLRFALVSKLLSEKALAVATRKLSPSDVSSMNLAPVMLAAVDYMEAQLTKNKQYTPVSFDEVLANYRYMEEQKKKKGAK